MFLSVCVGGQSRPDEAKDALTPTEISASRNQFDGQVLLIRGYLSIRPDEICLIDPVYAESDEVPKGAHFSVLGLELLRPNFEFFNGKEILITARFKSQLASENQWLLKGCGRSGILIESPQTPTVTEKGARGN